MGGEVAGRSPWNWVGMRKEPVGPLAFESVGVLFEISLICQGTPLENSAWSVPWTPWARSPAGLVSVAALSVSRFPERV